MNEARARCQCHQKGVNITSRVSLYPYRIYISIIIDITNINFILILFIFYKYISNILYNYLLI